MVKAKRRSNFFRRSKLNWRYLLVFLLVFAGVGWFIFHLFAAGTPNTLEAERMVRHAGVTFIKDPHASADHAVYIHSDTKPSQRILTGNIEMPDVVRTITVVARSQTCKGQAPTFKVFIKGWGINKKVLDATVRSVGWNTYKAALTSINLKPGKKYIINITYQTKFKCQTGLYLDVIKTPVLTPTINSITATTVADKTATLNSAFDTHNYSAKYHFEYGTDTHYGTTTSTGTAAVQNGDQAVNKAISGLAPNTTYHYRLCANNSGGSVCSPDTTFTTRVASDGTCSNGTTNYPTCTTCPAGQSLQNGHCAQTSVCSNGATNYPTCTTCPAGQAMSNGHCTTGGSGGGGNVCTNGTTNYPTCTTCPSGQSLQNGHCAQTSVCSNGATDYPTCTTCPSGQTLQNGQCAIPPPPSTCSNGATNYPTCTTCPSGQTLQNGQCAQATGKLVKIKSMSVSHINNTNAQVDTVFNDWDQPATSYIEYDIDTSYGIRGYTIPLNASANDQAQGSLIDKLSPGTTYYFHICYSNSAGTNCVAGSFTTTGGTQTNTCANGATNYAQCSICPSGQVMQNNVCVAKSCTNGATNYPNCNKCPSDLVYQSGSCVTPTNQCKNGATNYPKCNQCPAGYKYSDNTGKCKPIDGSSVKHTEAICVDYYNHFLHEGDCDSVNNPEAGQLAAGFIHNASGCFLGPVFQYIGSCK